jgi:lysozyme family protein
VKSLAIIGLVLAMGIHPGSLPEDKAPESGGTFQEQRWQRAEIRPKWAKRIDAAVDRYLRTHARYQTIEKMRKPGVPARVIFVLHGRESTWSFAKHLHEGSSLKRRTRWVPKGRPKRGSPPFTFEESAEDALYLLKDMENWEWGNLHSMLQNIETYNGLGYQKYHKDVPSPYLWSGTTVYTRGKYVSDGKFSKLAVDGQIGCAAILKRMRERGVR